MQAGADGRAAPGHAVQARSRPRRRAWSTSWSRPATSWSRPRRRGSTRPTPTPLPEPWDAPGYKMPGGTPKSPGAGRVPAGVPGAAAHSRPRAPSTRPPARSCQRRGRGREHRLRHRLADRVALPDQPGRQPGLEEHDPGVLLRPAGDQLRLAPPAGHRAVEGHQGRRPGRRHDGRRHRLRLRQGRHGGRPQGRRRRERREGQGLLRGAARQGDLAGPVAPRRRRPSCSAGSPRPPTRPTWPAATW